MKSREAKGPYFILIVCQYSAAAYRCFSIIVYTHMTVTVHDVCAGMYMYVPVVVIV